MTLNKKLTLQDETDYKFGGEAVFGVSKHIYCFYLIQSETEIFGREILV